MTHEAYSDGNSTQRVFFYIPDISGFTAFIKCLDDPKEAARIIHDLLNSIINANIFGLRIAEIQGDAILFYRFGPPLNLIELEKQTLKTFIDFHNILNKTGSRHHIPREVLDKITIKFVVHYGVVGTTMVNNELKLVGMDMIIANKILKNNIVGREYLLMTDAYLSTQKHDIFLYRKNFNWCRLLSGNCHYEHIGDIRFSHISLSPLRTTTFGQNTIWE